MSDFIPEDEAYDQEVESAEEDMRREADLYYDGSISENELKSRLRDRTKALYIALALLALGSSLEEEQDIEDLSVFLGITYKLIDDFIETVREERPNLSRGYVAWRSGLFSSARHVHTRFKMTHDLFNLMPVLPGIDCLGDGKCGCTLEAEFTEDGATVTWYLGATEHCEICLGAWAASPYTFSADELGL